MTPPTQWLVIPANPETRCYITDQKIVADKRASKGDKVQLIKRSPAEEEDEL